VSQKLYIISGNYDQYKKWVWERGFYGNKDFVFVAAPDAFRGVRNPGGRFIGTWYKRPDAFDILVALRVASDKVNENLEKALVLWIQSQTEKSVGAT
jgi:hypothetical protein